MDRNAQIIKAEVVRHPGRAPKNNPRFVVTNLPDTPESVYRSYCQRGDMENRLKELHHGLALDRTSCSRFLANQFRGLAHPAAPRPAARPSPAALQLVTRYKLSKIYRRTPCSMESRLLGHEKNDLSHLPVH